MITEKQRRVLNFISGYIASNQQSPTVAEIGRHFQLRSTASVHQIILVLEREKFITRVPNVSRGIRLVEGANDNAQDEANNGSNGSS